MKRCGESHSKTMSYVFVALCWEGSLRVCLLSRSNHLKTPSAFRSELELSDTFLNVEATFRYLCIEIWAYKTNKHQKLINHLNALTYEIFSSYLIDDSNHKNLI